MQSKMRRVSGVLGVIAGIGMAVPASIARADEEPAAEDQAAESAAPEAEEKPEEGQDNAASANRGEPSSAGSPKASEPSAGSGVSLLGDEEDLDAAVVDDRARRDRPMLGVAFRVRQIYLPERVLELFVEDAPGSESHLGYGVELFRKKGSFTFAIGFEYEKLAAAEGVWVDKGESIPASEADFIEFDDFSWYAVDLSFIWQTQLGRYFALRYGTGFGVGFIQGELLRTDVRCETDDPATCEGYAGSLNDRTPDEDVPPVFPVINLLLGAQFRPIENIAFNVEAGLRTVPFVGTSLAVMF